MTEEETQHGATAVEEAVETEERVREGAEPEAEKKEEAVPAEEIPTKEQRFLAGLAHFCIIAVLPVVLAPLVIWQTEKDKPRRSEYILHHARQALLYQVLLVGAVAVMTATVVLAPLAALVALIGTIYGVVGGILACTGRKFNYIWVGKYVRQWSS